MIIKTEQFNLNKKQGFAETKNLQFVECVFHCFKWNWGCVILYVCVLYFIDINMAEGMDLSLLIKEVDKQMKHWWGEWCRLN